jgi:hypothetical protein
MSEIKNLATKMVKIMSETKRIAKNGTNAFHNYQYVTEADVLESVRDVLAKYNVFIFSSVIGTDKNADMTSVVMQHTIVDADSGESFDVKSFGQGQDKGDKGGNKAVTASMKYMLLKNLLLPTGDDPEATDESGKSTGPKSVKIVAATSGVSTTDIGAPKKYGFSGKSKPAVAAVAPAPAVVSGSDDF